MAADTVQLVNKPDTPPAAPPVAEQTKQNLYYPKFGKRVVRYLANSEVYSGAGVWEEWTVCIFFDGKRYLKDVGTVVRLNEQNTVPQNEHIIEELSTDPNIAEDALLILHHDTSINRDPPPLPKKVMWIIEKLNS